MGLLDKIKQAKNFVTGGGANVTVTPEGAEFDKTQPIKVRITAQIKDADLNASAAYLDIRCREDINLRASVNGKKENINEDHVSYTHKVEVQVSEPLKGGETYNWETEFSIGDNAQPTFHGTMARNVWEVRGGVDVKGNDPDSGWIEIRVR